MTLTELAQKHNLEPKSAKAFLREWLDIQNVIGYEVEELTPTQLQKHNGPIMKYLSYNQRGRFTPLIARPTDLGE